MRRGERARFTLIEVVLALGIAAARAGDRLRRAAGGRWPRGARARRARPSSTTRAACLVLLERALDGAFPYRFVPAEQREPRVLFEGRPDQVTFATLAPPFPGGVPIAFTAVSLSQRGDRGWRSASRCSPIRSRSTASRPSWWIRETAAVRFRYLGEEPGAWQDDLGHEPRGDDPARGRDHLRRPRRARAAPRRRSSPCPSARPCHDARPRVRPARRPAGADAAGGDRDRARLLGAPRGLDGPLLPRRRAGPAPGRGRRAAGHPRDRDPGAGDRARRGRPARLLSRPARPDDAHPAARPAPRPRGARARASSPTGSATRARGSASTPRRPDRLGRLLEALGLERTERDIITDSLQDWRDAERAAPPPRRRERLLPGAARALSRAQRPTSRTRRSCSRSAASPRISTRGTASARGWASWSPRRR